ncbi:hypothetical protein QE152_g38303 [Popillia japonica]|uniref:Uncharacterized protein n=1 Tax=Popillia japonica TaxID=7064 RepID=A0AAW1I723_POPJA
MTWKQKDNVWKIIEKEYNAQSSVYRSTEYDLTSLPVSENVDATLALEKEEMIIIQMDTEEYDANGVHNAGWDDCTPEMLRAPLHPALKEKIGRNCGEHRRIL